MSKDHTAQAKVPQKAPTARAVAMSPQPDHTALDPVTNFCGLPDRTEGTEARRTMVCSPTRIISGTTLTGKPNQAAAIVVPGTAVWLIETYIATAKAPAMMARLAISRTFIHL